MDIITFMASFKTEKDCLDYLREKRYAGFTCPKCGNQKFYMIYSRKCMECSRCMHQEYLTAGTIFHKSSTPLMKWFFAIMQLTQSKKGISALQLKTQLKVTYKTAWRIAHKIREAMDKDDDDHDLFGGITQVDESYIGGQQKGKRGRGAGKKAVVVGAVEHIGGKPTRVECDLIPRADGFNLHRFITEKINKKAELHTDKWPSYRRIEERGYNHRTVDHERFFVQNGVSTQSIEGFWSLLKRGIIGVYHHVSPQHLEKYLAEFEFRYNNRKQVNLFSLVITNV